MVWCLMDATSLAGLVPRKIAAPGAVAMATASAIAHRTAHRRDSSDVKLPFALSLAAAAVHAASGTKLARSQPIAPHNNRRRTPVTQAMYPAAAILGFAWQHLSRHERFEAIATMSTVAGVTTATAGRPLVWRDQLINWGFVASAFGAADRFRMWSDRSTRNLVAALLPATNKVVDDIAIAETRREWGSLASDVEEAIHLIQLAEIGPGADEWLQLKLRQLTILHRYARQAMEETP